MRHSWPILLLLMLVGCGSSSGSASNVSLKELPEPVLRAARERLPDVRFQKAWKAPSVNYGLRGKNKKGKTRTVQVSPSGEVVAEE